MTTAPANGNIPGGVTGGVVNSILLSIALENAISLYRSVKVLQRWGALTKCQEEFLKDVQGCKLKREFDKQLGCKFKKRERDYNTCMEKAYNDYLACIRLSNKTALDELEKSIYDELVRLGDTAGEAEIDLEEILFKIDLDAGGRN